MIALLRKELLGLRPLLVLGGALYLVLPVLDQLLSMAPDQARLWQVLRNGEDGMELLGFLFAFGLGTRLLMVERDQHTLEFLDSLPTTRAQVFGAKVLAGVLLVLASSVFDLLRRVLLRAWSLDSLDPSLHLGWILGSEALLVAYGFSWLAVGLALGPLRRVGWAIVFSGVILHGILATRYRWLRLLDTSALIAEDRVGAQRVVPWDVLGVHAVLVLLLLIVAWLGFRRLSVAPPQEVDADARTARLATVVAGVALVGSCLAVSGKVSVGADRAGPGAEFADPRPLLVATRSYLFRVPAGISAEARAVLLDADRLADEVQRRFDVELPEPILVEATRGLQVGRHAGQATWKTVALQLGALERVEQLPALLVHETTHVYASFVSDRRIADAKRWTRAFDEGLATVFEEDVAGSPPRRAAAAWARFHRRVDPESVLDAALLRRDLHDDVAYELGAELVRAMIDLAGEDAPVRVVRAFGRKDLRHDLGGLELWRDTCQAAGLNLDRLIARHLQRLDALVEERRELLESVPRAFVSLSAGEDDEILAHVAFDGPLPPGAQVACVLRPERDDSETAELASQVESTDTPCRFEDDGTLGARVRVQVGVALASGEHLMEPWVTLPAP